MDPSDRNVIKTIFTAIAMHALLVQARESSQVLSADDRVARLAQDCITERAMAISSMQVDKLVAAGVLV